MNMRKKISHNLRISGIVCKTIENEHFVKFELMRLNTACSFYVLTVEGPA